MDEAEDEDLALALDATTRRALPVIYLGVGGFYVLLLAVMPFVEDGARASASLMARWAGTAAFALLGGWFLAKVRVPPGWANALAGVLGALTVLNSLFLVAEAGPSFLFAIVTALLAFALFLLAIPWVVGLCALALGGWLAMAADAGGGPEWAPRTINLLAIVMLALVAQVMRVRLHARVARLTAMQLKRVQQEEQLLRERALNDQRRRIVRMTAHELATPLTPVLLQAHLLSRGELSDAQRNTLAVLQRNLERLHETIDKIVAAAQADEKTAELYQSNGMAGT